MSGPRLWARRETARGWIETERRGWSSSSTTSSRCLLYAHLHGSQYLHGGVGISFLWSDLSMPRRIYRANERRSRRNFGIRATLSDGKRANYLIRINKAKIAEKDTLSRHVDWSDGNFSLDHHFSVAPELCAQTRNFDSLECKEKSYYLFPRCVGPYQRVWDVRIVTNNGGKSCCLFSGYSRCHKIVFLFFPKDKILTCSSSF